MATATLLLALSPAAPACVAQQPTAGGRPQTPPSAVDVLNRLQDTSASVSALALEEVRRGGPALVAQLDGVVRGPDERRRALGALALYLAGPAALPRIRAILHDTGSVGWFPMVQALMRMSIGDSSACALIVQLMADPSADVRATVVEVLMFSPRRWPGIERYVVALLRDPSPKVRKKAAFQAFYLTDSTRRMEAVAALTDMLGDSAIDVRQEAAYMLGNMHDDAVSAVPTLVNHLRGDPVLRIRRQAAYSLGWIGPRAAAAVPALLAATRDADDTLRLWALRALGDIGTRHLTLPLSDTVMAIVRAHPDETLGLYPAQRVEFAADSTIHCADVVSGERDAAMATVVTKDIGSFGLGWLKSTQDVHVFAKFLVDSATTLGVVMATAEGGVMGVHYVALAGRDSLCLVDARNVEWGVPADSLIGGRWNDAVRRVAPDLQAFTPADARQLAAAALVAATGVQWDTLSTSVHWAERGWNVSGTLGPASYRRLFFIRLNRYGMLERLFLQEPGNPPESPF